MQNQPDQDQRRPRSPKFPVVPIKKALDHVRTIHQEFGVEPVGAPRVMKALGFDALSGRAYRVLAALKAYGLITRVHEKGAQIQVSATGAKLAVNPKGENLKELRLAALEPRPFRRIWLNRPRVTEDELVALFAKRNFTETGAQRAARVFTANARFAQLEDPDFRASGVVTVPPKWNEKGRGQDAGQGVEDRCVADNKVGNVVAGAGVQQRLRVPLGKDFASIPLDLSKDDFQLLMQTLRLWRPQIIAA